MGSKLFRLKICGANLGDKNGMQMFLEAIFLEEVLGSRIWRANSFESKSGGNLGSKNFWKQTFWSKNVVEEKIYLAKFGK